MMKEEDYEYKASLGHTVKSCLNKTTNSFHLFLFT
jgi:hypothetical protein